MPYDATILDCDGVIVEPPATETLGAAASTALDRVGLDADPRAVAAALFAGDVDALAERCRRGGVAVATFCQRAAGASFEAQRDELEAGLRTAHADVRALWDLDTPLGLVSDNQPQVVEFVLDRFDLGDLFETVRCRPVTPHGLPRCKPDPRNLTAAMTDLDAERAVYVGDRVADVEAAHRAGIDGVLVARGDVPAGGRDRADHVVQGLDELPAVVA